LAAKELYGSLPDYMDRIINDCRFGFMFTHKKTQLYEFVKRVKYYIRIISEKNEFPETQNRVAEKTKYYEKYLEKCKKYQSRYNPKKFDIDSLVNLLNLHYNKSLTLDNEHLEIAKELIEFEKYFWSDDIEVITSNPEVESINIHDDVVGDVNNVDIFDDNVVENVVDDDIVVGNVVDDVDIVNDNDPVLNFDSVINNLDKKESELYKRLLKKYENLRCFSVSEVKNYMYSSKYRPSFTDLHKFLVGMSKKGAFKQLENFENIFYLNSYNK
jgi:hypothetical protein